MIIIDGYNLIGAAKSIKLSDSDAKTKLLELLDEYQKIIERKIIVVFDRNSQDGYEFEKFNNINIHYPLEHESADDAIIKLVNKYRNQHGYAVISSDNKILDRAKKAHLSCQNSKEFYEDIEKAILNVNTDSQEYLSPMETDRWLELFRKKK